ncbi:hypothetical protein WK13_34805 [Burkholderia ubonensis]|uniref:hypothetical protein n=1 Tax=Burkholderia ubonensis TaxID=101571 RepID=UPI00076C992F|nr:hypothetical protein [Burkholderia ubonensis]KVR21711.1 hypothetical protein WK13_34805 [Burkholderia ubonensis]
MTTSGVTLTAPGAKELIETLRATPVGDSVLFPSPMPGIDASARLQGMVLEAADEKWWRIGLYWQSVSLGEITVELHENKLILETL